MNAQEKIDSALEAIATIEEALEAVKDSLETAVDDAQQQAEDGELDPRDTASAALEIMDGVSENISLIRGTADQLGAAVG